MDENRWLVDQFEANRANLQAMAYRMLGSLNEAEDAVQESWLRLHRADTSGVEDLSRWLTTVIARVCLDKLRSRKSRRENPLDADADTSQELASHDDQVDPEHEALLADSVGLALLVVLETLAPAERLAFVLHDLFAMSFEEIAPLVGRTSTAARKLASRARRRVHGVDMVRAVDISRQRTVVEAFLAASRTGNIEALLAILDPDVVVRADSAALPPGAATEVRGAAAVLKQALHFAERTRFAQLALVNGTVGAVVAPRGHLFLVATVEVKDAKIVAIEIIADPERLRQLDLAILD
ncbi:MAG: sigma-70 family RNA polymerase sigma factor [Chloroflexota bacterium]